MSRMHASSKLPKLATAFAVTASMLASTGDVEKLQPKLSTGTAVPVTELQAIGTLGGCTATLVTQSMVLTAAHCVCAGGVAANCVKRATFTLPQVFPVSGLTRKDVSMDGNVRVHPQFGVAGWLREDLAVVDLDKPANQLVKGVVPIAVEEPQNIPFAGNNLTLVGFGVTGPGCSLPATGKMKLTLPITAISSGGILFSHPGKHTCPGDSGGPVLNGAGHVVGVASWTNSASDSTYRPTHSSYNWIFNYGDTSWGTCAWVKVGALNSHQPSPVWCPAGTFLTQFDLDGDRSLSTWDAPIVGQASCCSIAGLPAQWGACTWQKVGPLNSHQPSSTWCPAGTFLTQFDLDGDRSLSDYDAPIVGQARCCKLATTKFTKWGSSYWEEVGALRSHQPGPPWCPAGSLMVQFDLDGDRRFSPYDTPIVGQAKCAKPRP